MIKPTDETRKKKTFHGNRWRAWKLFRYIRFYLARLDDSNVVQIYRKSVLSKFLRCAVNIHSIFDKEKFSLGARWQDTLRKGLWNFTASRRALKIIRYLWFYLAQLDDSNAEIVQIYRKSDLLKFLRCAVNIHLIFDREKLALGTRWQDNWESSLKFHGMPASFEKYSISLVLFGTIGWFKHWNSPYLEKECFIEVLTMCR